MNDELFDDLALDRLSRPASLPGGLSRRRFLQLAGAGAGVATMGSMLSSLDAFAAPPVGANDGIVVLIMMDGGNDGLNTVIPTGESSYYALRPALGIRPSQALGIGGGFGLHPALPRLKARFDRGDVAIVQGVGYGNPDLSHFTSMGIWMNGWGGATPSGPPTGWIGRYLDGLPNAAAESLYGVVVGTSVPLHMVGSIARSSGLPTNLGGAFGIDRRDANDARMYDALGAFSSGATGLGQWGDLAAKVEHDTLDLAQRIQPAYQGTFPDTHLGRQLTLVAKLINTNLGIRAFNTNVGGFDTHSGQAGNHASQLGEMDDAIEAFFATLAPAWQNRVTVMTFSEFGRRPEENTDAGTDHGTASPLFVVGPRVKGGLYGAPSRTNDLDGNGNLKYHVDFRKVYATVLDTWLKADSRQVLGYNFGSLNFFDSGPGSVSAVPARPHRHRRRRVTA